MQAGGAIRYNQRKSDKFIVFFISEDKASGKSNQSLAGRAGEHWGEIRSREVSEVERGDGEMGREAEERGPGTCRRSWTLSGRREGKGWMPTLEAHSTERGCWIQLRRSNAQIRRNPKENRTA